MTELLCDSASYMQNKICLSSVEWIKELIHLSCLEWWLQQSKCLLSFYYYYIHMKWLGKNDSFRTFRNYSEPGNGYLECEFFFSSPFVPDLSSLTLTYFGVSFGSKCLWHCSVKDMPFSVINSFWNRLFLPLWVHEPSVHKTSGFIRSLKHTFLCAFLVSLVPAAQI